MTDLLGLALSEYYFEKSKFRVYTSTSISGAERLSLAYLLRKYNQMPDLEKIALKNCCGSILDLGCGGGSHSLYLQQQQMDVTACDISENMIRIAQNRGVKKTVVGTIASLAPKSFDTILVLMNGTGLASSISQLGTFLQSLTEKLRNGGQILIDSTDIAYMYEADPDVNEILNASKYYGELQFNVSYRGEKSSFPWLYVDFKTLQTVAKSEGLQCSLVADGGHHHYLAKLVKL